MVHVLSLFYRHLDVPAYVEKGDPYCLTSFYGDADRGMRERPWVLFRELAMRSNLHWVLIGYFNELLDTSGKRGASFHSRHLLQNFQPAIQECRLKNFGFVRHKFFCERRKGG